MEETAPTKAESQVAADMLTFSGTWVSITLPLTMRQPFWTLGAAVIVIFLKQCKGTAFVNKIKKKSRFRYSNFQLIGYINEIIMQEFFFSQSQHFPFWIRTSLTLYSLRKTCIVGSFQNPDSRVNYNNNIIIII